MKIERVRCKNCGSTQVYTRISTRQRVCKQCGFIENIELEGGLYDNVKKKKKQIQEDGSRE